MARREFPRAIKVAVIKRATRGDPPVTYCEACSLPCRKWQIDHIRADGLGGKPTIENAQLLCAVCYGAKNPQDTRAIAKGKRREAAELRAAPAPAKPIEAPGFRRSQRTLDRKSREQLPLPPRRHQQACRRFSGRARAPPS